MKIKDLRGTSTYLTVIHLSICFYTWFIHTFLNISRDIFKFRIAMKRNSFCHCIICPLLCNHFVCTIISFQGSWMYWHLVLLWSLHTSMIYATAKHTFCISFICCCSATQSCQILCDPMDCSTPGLHVPHHPPELEFAKFIAFPFSRGSSQPRDRTQVSHTAHGFFTNWATREAQEYWSG